MNHRVLGLESNPRIESCSDPSADSLGGDYSFISTMNNSSTKRTHPWPTIARVGLRIPMLALLLCATGCELFFDAAEMGDLAAEEGGFAGGVVARSLARAATAEALAAETTLRGVLEDAVTGSRAVRITASGELLMDGTRVGTLERTGAVYLENAAGKTTLAGQVLEGRLWAKDLGSNAVPIARVRGLTSQNGVVATRSPGGAEVFRLERSVAVEVTRARAGFFEIRVRGTQTGWVPASTLLLSLVADTSLNHSNAGAEVCSNIKFPTDTIQTARPDDGSTVLAADLAAGLRGREITVRFAAHQADLGRKVAGTLVNYGASVRMIETDSVATTVCGGDVYYNTKDIAAALSARSALASLVDLRTTSLAKPAATVIWIK